MQPLACDPLTAATPSAWAPADDALTGVATAATCPSGASCHDLCGADAVFGRAMSGLEAGPDHDWHGMACADLAQPGDAWEAFPFGRGGDWLAPHGAPCPGEPAAAATASPCTDDGQAPSLPPCAGNAPTSTGAGHAGTGASGAPNDSGSTGTASMLPAHHAPPPRKRHHRVATAISRPRAAPKKMHRKVGSPTALRLLYITKGMHTALGLDGVHSRPSVGRRGSACIIHVTAADAAVDGPFPVTMTTTTFKGHAHRRFSAGWREFCAAAGVQVGDTITFARGPVAGHLTVSIARVAGARRP